MPQSEYTLDELNDAIALAEAAGAEGLPQVFALSLRYAEMAEQDRLPMFLDVPDDETPIGLDDDDEEWEDEMDDDALAGPFDELLDIMDRIVDRMVMETDRFGEIVVLTDIFLALIESGEIAQRPQALAQYLKMADLIVDGLWRIQLLQKIAEGMLARGDMAAARNIADMMAASIPYVMREMKTTACAIVSQIYLRLNETDKALELLEQGLGYAVPSDHRASPNVEGMIEVFVSITKAGEDDRARDVLEMIFKSIDSDGMGNWFLQVYAYDALISAVAELAAMGDETTALELIEWLKRKLDEEADDDAESEFVFEDEDEDDDWMYMVDARGADFELMIKMADQLLHLERKEAALEMTEKALASLAESAEDEGLRHYIIPFIEVAALFSKLGRRDQARDLINQAFIAAQTFEDDCRRGPALAAIARGWAILDKLDLAFAILDQAVDLLLRCSGDDSFLEDFHSVGTLQLIKAMTLLKEHPRVFDYIPRAFRLAESVGPEYGDGIGEMHRLMESFPKVERDWLASLVHDAFRRARGRPPINVWMAAKDYAPFFARLGVAGSMWDEAIGILMAAVK